MATTILELIVYFYLGFLIVELLNKLAHSPTKGIYMQRWVPIPKGVSKGSEFRWGGMFIYLTLAVGVAYFKPDLLPIQIIGLISWVLFITHGIIGSLNYEIPMTRFQIRKYVVDDIPNDLWYIFIPAALLLFCLYCSYYFGVIELIYNLVVIV